MPGQPRQPTGPGRASPWRLGGLSLRQFARDLYAGIAQDEILDRAASLSYYFVLALFPTLLFLTALLGLLPGSRLMEQLLRYGDQVLPPDAASLLARTLAEVERGANRGLLSLGAVGTLWAASRGIRSLIVALNVVYDVPAARPWWRRQLVAMALTVALGVFTVGALLLLGFGQRIGQAVAAWTGIGAQFTAVWAVAQWPLAIALGIVGLDLAYYLAPAARPRWAWITPGAVVAVVGWLVMALGLRAYVNHFADYNATYGSIGAVIVLMLWLYLSGAAVLVGGEVNAVLARAERDRGSWANESRETW